jgi:hypothetical protein
MIGMFPLLLIVVVIYAVIAFAGDMIFGGGEEAFQMLNFVEGRFLGIDMPSNIEWILSRGDVFLLVGLALLFMEVIASTRSDKRTIINHGLSMGVFVGALLAFVLNENFATSTFFFLMVLTLIDVVAGFIITIRVARRDIGFGGDIPGI